MVIVIWRVLLINDMWFVSFFFKSDWKIIYESFLTRKLIFIFNNGLKYTQKKCIIKNKPFKIIQWFFFLIPSRKQYHINANNECQNRIWYKLQNYPSSIFFSITSDIGHTLLNKFKTVISKNHIKRARRLYKKLK